MIKKLLPFFLFSLLFSKSFFNVNLLYTKQTTSGSGFALSAGSEVNRYRIYTYIGEYVYDDYDIGDYAIGLDYLLSEDDFTPFVGISAHLINNDDRNIQGFGIRTGLLYKASSKFGASFYIENIMPNNQKHILNIAASLEYRFNSDIDITFLP